MSIAITEEDETNWAKQTKAYKELERQRDVALEVAREALKIAEDEVTTHFLVSGRFVSKAERIAELRRLMQP